MPDQTAATGPEPDETESESEAAASTDGAEAADTGPGFMNRAARRAHARGTTPQRSAGTSGQFGRGGTVQRPRQWGNRRTG